MRKTIARATVGLLIFGAAFAGVAAWNHAHASHDIALTGAQARKEYVAAEPKYPLAPGWRYKPEREVSRLPNGDKQLYQPGVAINDVELRWFCSWTSYSQGGQQARLTAVQHLERFKSTRLYSAGSDENTKVLLQKVYSAMSSSDSSQIVSVFLSRNCEN